MFSKWWLSFSLCCSSIFGGTYYGACYDLDMSPYAGGENLLFATEIVEEGSRYLDRHISLPAFPGFLYRATELCALYLPMNDFASTIQHEVFGHGYRIRDISHGIASVTGYSFSWPLPYGDGSAATYYSYYPYFITTTDLSTIAIGGFEAQSILAEQTKWKWMESETVDPRQSALYLLSRYAISLYHSGKGFDPTAFGNHDLIDYTIALNYTYTKDPLTVARIRALSLVNLIDPFTYYSLFAWGRYLLFGQDTPLLWIPIGETNYLFSLQMGLTPFGLEYFSYHYLNQKNRLLSFYLKGG